nr:thiamine pyrophosphate-binding protein [uncultured Blautia sp.]
MKQKVSDYIADHIAEWGIRDVFTVTGGGAMHMNDAFGHHPKLHCTYQHHEQACAMAAEAYARMDNRMAAVCVTTGPGATNAITGVLGGWMDSIPMLVFSGQARYATTVAASGLKLRSMGVQECNIVPVVASITKYAQMIIHPEDIRYHLEKALYMAVNGRPGPVWLDIPLDVQGAVIETEELRGYDPQENPEEKPAEISQDVIQQIMDKIEKSHRPVLFPGNGVRLAGAMDDFQKLVNILGVPVITGMSSVDAMESEHPYFAGRSGGTGTRPGNFALQNSDVLLSIGNRQGFAQTGFQYQDWARGSYTILNDIDENELKKPSLHVSLPVCGDAGDLIRKLICAAELRGADETNPLFKGRDWIRQCQVWKQKYPVVTAKHYETIEEGCTNIYAFYEELSKAMQEGQTLMVSVGTSRVAGSQAFRVKKGQRFITNPNTASMGFCLPAATGICVAQPGKPVVCVTGEGSLQMNLQELQTIWQNRLPVKLFVINNQGYHSIRQTQQSYFEPPLVGVGAESGDLSFPDLSRIIPAYGFSYRAVHAAEELPETLHQILEEDGASVCEVFVTKYQKTEPKTSAKKLPDGSMVSAPLEDMYPFLSKEELEENMFTEMNGEVQ